MKISIITATYNSEATVADTMRSVAAQTYEKIEHIIIDGASKDRTLDVVGDFGSRVVTVLSEPDCGIYDAMNKGLGLATGDVIGFLNSDDVFENSHVVSKIAHAMSKPSTEACYGDLVYVSQDNLSKVIRYWKSQVYQHGLFARGWVPAHPTFYAKLSLYRKYGGFDLNMHYAADFDLMLRFLEVHGVVSTYIPDVLVRMRLGGATNASFRNVVRQNLEISRSFRKYGLKGGMRQVAAKLLSRVPQFFRRPSES